MSKVQKEVWKDIPNYEGHYKVSNHGQVKSFKQGKEINLTLVMGYQGYLKVNLIKDGIKKSKTVHRLVMLAFLGESDLQVNHKNGIKTDNRLENLEYCTASENTMHAYKTGLMPKGEKSGRAKLTRACAERIKYGHQGMTQKEIADIYGVYRTLVGHIRLGKIWKHI